jgi:DNA-binding transcriptional LysR family regulator
MHLTIRHLQVFEALMDAGSVSRAAERMNLTQPAVSVALSNLEKSLGFRLFHRSKGFFAPTGEAEILHVEAELVLLAIERFQARARDIALGAVGGVTIASNGASAINFLPRLIAEFRRSRPGVHIDLKVRSSRQVASWVAGGQIDIGLLDAPVPVSGVDAQIFRLPCVCILREDDPLSVLSRIGPADLAGRSLIAVTGDHSVDRQIGQAFSAAGIVLERQIYGSFFAIARNLVKAEAGIAIIDCINGAGETGDGVTWRPFEPTVYFELALIQASHRAMQQSAEAFMSELRSRLSHFAAQSFN